VEHEAYMLISLVENRIRLMDLYLIDEGVE